MQQSVAHRQTRRRGTVTGLSALLTFPLEPVIGGFGHLHHALHAECLAATDMQTPMKAAVELI
jgi:hypothetical protein